MTCGVIIATETGTYTNTERTYEYNGNWIIHTLKITHVTCPISSLSPDECAMRSRSISQKPPEELSEPVI